MTIGENGTTIKTSMIIVDAYGEEVVRKYSNFTP